MGYTDVLTLQSLKGANKKLQFLKEHSEDEWLRRFLYYALNPLLTYNLSEKTLRVEDESSVPDTGLVFFKDIFECCEYLSRLRALDDATVRQVKILLYRHCSGDAREIYIKLLSKTLRLGVTAKTVNKAVPNLIPEWEVQQAFPIDKYPAQKGKEFWLTQKLNGTRATFYKGRLVARSGSAYKGLDHIVRELNRVQRMGYVLDGELTLREKGNLSDNEAFRVATGIINSDAEDKREICYTVFDAIPLRDFEGAESGITYSKRRAFLDSLAEQFNVGSSVRILRVLYHGQDISMIDKLLEQMVREDKEGLMLNYDVPYKRARHKGILKIKRFYTMDLPVVGYEEGTGRLEGTLGALVLDYKGNKVKVGSGFTDEQRTVLWRKQDELVGLLCEVKYKEVSKDKNTGLESLQFPVFVQIRNDKTEVSYG